jgi:hypothetical protein
MWQGYGGYRIMRLRNIIGKGNGRSEITKDKKLK